jgi:hypothetical protein
MIKLVKRHRVTFHLKTGVKLVFDAADIELNYDNEGITHYSVTKGLRAPLYVHPRQIAAVTSRYIWVWRRWR